MTCRGSCQLPLGSQRLPLQTRSAKSRSRAEIRDSSRRMQIAAVRRKFHRSSQYLPSKYASDFSRLSGGTVANHAFVAAAGSMALGLWAAAAGGAGFSSAQTGIATITNATPSKVMIDGLITASA